MSGIPVIKDETIDEVITSIEGNTGLQYLKQTLITSIEPVQCQGGSCPSVSVFHKHSYKLIYIIDYFKYTLTKANDKPDQVIMN